MRADSGDEALLELAASSNRILITIDTDFGELIFRHGQSHTELVRIPDVPVQQRTALMNDVIERYGAALEDRSVITIRSGRIRSQNERIIARHV